MIITMNDFGYKSEAGKWCRTDKQKLSLRHTLLSKDLSLAKSFLVA